MGLDRMGGGGRMSGEVQMTVVEVEGAGSVWVGWVYHALQDPSDQVVGVSAASLNGKMRTQRMKSNEQTITMEFEQLKL